MLRSVAAGFALGIVVAGAAFAAPGPIIVETDTPGPVSNLDPFAADLLSIGVNDQIGPAAVTLNQPTKLTFRLLAAIDRRADGLANLVVDGVSYDIAPQPFSATGLLLGTQLFSGAFSDKVGFLTNLMAADPGDPPPLPWPEGVNVYLLPEDELALEGVGPFIGKYEKIYFSFGDVALFEVSATTVPEPATWGLLIGGFALSGAALRRSRGRPTTPAVGRAREPARS